MSERDLLPCPKCGEANYCIWRFPALSKIKCRTTHENEFVSIGSSYDIAVQVWNRWAELEQKHSTSLTACVCSAEIESLTYSFSSDYIGGWWHISCLNCELRGPRCIDKEKARERWNSIMNKAKKRES